MKKSDFKKITEDHIHTCREIIKGNGDCTGECFICPFDKDNSPTGQKCGDTVYAIAVSELINKDDQKTNEKDLIDLIIASNAFIDAFDKQPSKKTNENQTKEITMKERIKKTASRNKKAAIEATKIEAGKIAIKQVKKLIAPKLPLVVRGYADSPIFDIVLANLFAVAGEQLRPGDEKVEAITDIMLAAAFQEQIQHFKIGELFDELISTISVPKNLK